MRCASPPAPMTPDEEFTYVGEVIDDSTFSFVCSLDKDDDPLEDPNCWVKANPLLGVTVTKEYLASNVKQAKRDSRETERHPTAALLPMDGCGPGLDGPPGARRGAGRLRSARACRQAMSRQAPTLSGSQDLTPWLLR